MNIISRKVEELLHQYGDYYLENFNEKEVTQHLFGGDLTITNMKLKPEAFDQKSSPFKLKEGTISEVVLKIPWKNIFNEAVIIKITGAHIVAETKTLKDVNLSQEEEARMLLKSIASYTKQQYLNQLGAQSSVLNFWIVKNLIDRIIDNVQISIRNIHIQIDHKVVEQPFSIVVSMKDLELYTTDSAFMSKQFVKQAKEVEGSTKKQIFKVLNLNNFHVDIKPFVEENKIMKPYDNATKYSIFKVSFQVRLIKNIEHGELDPDYEASVKFNQNDLSLTHWQIQRILNLLDYMKKLSEKLEAVKVSFKYHPQRRIAEFFRIDPGQNPEIVATYLRLKKVCIANWWQFCIMEVLKSLNKNKKRDVKGKFYSLVASMNIDKLLDYEIPGVMNEAYEQSFQNYLEQLVHVNFDIDKLQTNDLAMHKLESLLFIYPERMQKVIANKFARDYAAKVKERQRNTWTNYALSFIPFMGDPGLTSDQKEFKQMLEGEFGSEKKKKFSKYILKLSLEIKKGSYSLLSDPDPKTGVVSQFGFFTDNFSVDLKMFDGKTEASVDLKSFEFSFDRDIHSTDKKFAVIKSTAAKGTSFLNVKVLFLQQKTKTTTSVDVYIQHIDVIFLNQIIKDLINFFKVQRYDSEAAAGIVSGAGKYGAGSAANATKAVAQGSNDISINVNLLSPRLMIPMAKNLSQLTQETNLFVFYLGDMEFQHTLKSGPMSNLGKVFNLKLNHCKLEYWEDYRKAMRHLKIEEVDELDEIVKADNDMISSFVMMDFVAMIKYIGSGDGKSQNVNVLVENFDLRINPYTFHQLLNIQKLVDFSNELKPDPKQLMAAKSKIKQETVLEAFTPTKKRLEDKYEMKYVVVTKSMIYVFDEPDDIEPEVSYSLNGYSIYVAEELKTKGYILKVWKDKVVVSIAFRTFEEVKNWVNRIIEVVPGVTTKSLAERAKEELPFVINLDVIVKSVEVWLYNEVFERSLALVIKYLEVKFAKEQVMKVKLVMESLLVENFEKSFASRGLKLICWIGSAQSPSAHERRALRARDDNRGDRTRQTDNVSSLASDIPRAPQTIVNAVAPSMRSSVLEESMVIRGEAQKKVEQNAQNVVERIKGGGKGLANAIKGEVKEGLGQTKVNLKPNAPSAHVGGDPKAKKDVSAKVDNNIQNWSEKGKIRDGNHHNNLNTEERDSRGDFRNVDDFGEIRYQADMQGLRRIDEGFIMYYEQAEKVQDIDIHMVNVTAFWDTDYIQTLQKKISDFVKLDQFTNQLDKEEKEIKEQKALEAKKKKKKVDPATIPDIVSMRAQVRIDRVCLVCRTKNQNLGDVVLIDMKVVFTQFNKRMLANIYMKRLALRDLTNYPFTKTPDRLKSYRHQNKNLMASFIETSKTTNLENLDNNGVLVVAEVINPDFINPRDQIATKAEIILNNGEINFFMQPVMRFVDFVLVQVLGYLLPDDSKKISNDEVLRRSSELKKLSFNVFMKNTRINCLPNFYVDKCLILEIPMVMILNEQYEDKTRNPTGQREIPVYSENISIEAKQPVLKGLRKGVHAFDIKDVTVGLDRLMNGGNIERILGKERTERDIVKKNKVIITIDELEVNLRRDEYYALQTWIFNSPAYNDYMDEFLMVSQPNPLVPALPQDIRILMQPVGVIFMDDMANEFAAVGFDLFYVDIKMTSDRRQILTIFGKGLTGDVVSPVGNGDIIPMMPFIKEMNHNNYDIFGARDYREGEKYELHNKNKSDKKYQNLSVRKDDLGDRKSVAEKLFNAVKVMEQNPNANFFIEIIQKANGEGQLMTITIKRIGANAVVPVILSILRIVAMKDEMNMNDKIKPRLKKGYGTQNITINMEDVFVFIMPPRGQKNSLVVHVPEMSIFQANDWKDREAMVRNEIFNYFDPNEFQTTDEWQQLTQRNPEKLIQVSQMAMAINNPYMDIVPTERISAFVEGRIEKDENLNISRNIMQPTFIAYQVRTYKLVDATTEMTFSRGVANIGAVNLLMNIGVLEYLLAWQQESDLPHLKNLALDGVYDAHVKTIIKKSKVVDKFEKKQIKFNSFDIVFQGVNLTLLDDVYNTNLPLLHFTVMPISISQVENADYNGFKDIGISLEASVYNFNSQEWEPILENFNLSIDQYTDQGDDKVGHTNVSFINGNPCINASTELAIIGQSIMNRLSKPALDKDLKATRSAVRQLAGRTFAASSMTANDFDRLAVLDKFRIFDFIRKIADSPYAENNMSAQGLENTRLYGYDEAVQVKHQGLSQLQISQANFQDKTSLKPKNPLNFRYNDTLPQGGVASNRDSQVHHNSQLSTGSHSKKNPIKSVYKANYTESMSPLEVQNLIAISDRQVDPTHNNIFLREIPFRVENVTGRDMVFALSFFDMPKMLFVRNLQSRDMEYPFTLENTLLQEGIIKSRTRNVFYKIFESDEEQRTYLLHQGSDLHSVRKIKIPYGQSYSKEEADLKYLILDISPLIMKKHILLKSPILLLNECRPHIQVHFFRGDQFIYTLQAAQNNVMPVPVDLLDCQFELDVANIGMKYKKRFSTIDLYSTPNNDIRICEVNELYSLHLYTIKKEDMDTTCLHICPPLVIKNMFLSGITILLYRNAMDREYADTIEVPYEVRNEEVYMPLLSEIIFSIDVGQFRSEKAKVDVEKVRKKEQLGTVWMTLNGKKKFTLNYSVIFRQGSFVLTVYVQHILYDELFKRMLISQRGTNFEDLLVPLESLDPATVLNALKSTLWNTTLTGTSALLTAESEDRYKSKIYMVPYPKEPIWVSDQKDKYEIASINTGSITDTDHTLKAISTSTNGVVNMDIVSSNSIFKLCNEPQIVMNLTYLRHKYLIYNQCGHEIQFKQVEYPDSVEKTVNNLTIHPVAFSPQENEADGRFINIGISGYQWSDKIRIDAPNMFYFMIKNVFDKEITRVNEFEVEKYITLSLQITPEDASYLLTVKRETQNGSFKFINNLDEMVVFLSQDPDKLVRAVAEVAMQPQTWAYYSWPSTFSKKRELYMLVFNLRTMKRSDIYKVDYQDTSRSYDLLGTRIYHNAEMSGASLNVKFSLILDQKEKRKLTNTLTASIPYLGISLIGGRRENRHELLFISLTELAVIRDSYDRITKTIAKIRYFNIDNNSEYLAYYPILFSPKYSYENIKRNDWQHIDFYLKNTNQDPKNPMPINIINKVDLKLIGNIVKIEESLLHNLLNSFDDFQKQSADMDTFFKGTQAHLRDKEPEKYKDFKNDLLLNAEKNYKTIIKRQVQEGKDKPKTYINEVYISEHDITVSFKKEPDDDPKAVLNKYSAYLKSLGFDYVFSIEDLNLAFSEFRLDNDIYPIPTVQKEIIKQYKNEGIKSALASLLDLKILGKPRTLAREIKAGVSDLVNKPADGLQNSKSALGLSKGLGKGASSFGRHLAVGTLGSISAITESAANLTSKLTLDNAYNSERNRIKSARANTVMTDMNRGMNQLGFSMKDSVAGVFNKPVEMGNQGGVGGAIKGSFVGLGGLIMKPITGLLDFASSATSNLKNKIDYDRLEPSHTRVRNPRAFYGENSYIKKYNDNDADVFNAVESQSRNRYDKLISYTQVSTPNSSQYQLLVNTVAYIYCLEPANKTFDWVLDKTVYFKVNRMEPNVLEFIFRDAETNTNRNERVVFYTREEMDALYNNVTQRNF